MSDVLSLDSSEDSDSSIVYSDSDPETIGWRSPGICDIDSECDTPTAEQSSESQVSLGAASFHNPTTMSSTADPMHDLKLPTMGEMSPDKPARGYRVVMVTTKPVHGFGLVSDNLYTVPELATDIRWNSTSIPTVTSPLTFRSHFALCLIPLDVWARNDKSLEWKFRGQRFLDYRGDLRNSSRASVWDQSRLRAITTMQDLGAVNRATMALEDCSRLYDRLVTNWGEYFPIWWNSSDFAIVLALLLVGDSATTECRRLMNHLALLREVEILVPRGTGTWLSAGGAGGALAVTTATGGLALPFIAAAAGCAALSSSILSFAEKVRRNKRLEACASLTVQFPELAPLFAA